MFRGIGRVLFIIKCLKQKETVNAEKYCRQSKELHKNFEKKRSLLVNRKGILFLHNNAAPHITQVTQEKVMELHIKVLSQPPYSPDLAPPDNHTCRSLQHYLEEKYFVNYEDVKNDIEYFFASKPRKF